MCCEQHTQPMTHSLHLNLGARDRSKKCVHTVSSVMARRFKGHKKHANKIGSVVSISVLLSPDDESSPLHSKYVPLLRLLTRLLTDCAPKSLRYDRTPWCRAQ